MSGPPPWLRPHGRAWTSRSERLVYDNPWIAVTEHAATAPTGAAATYGKVHFKNAALAVLPVHDDGTVVLVGQARFPCADYSWEVIMGGGALNAPLLASAQRELREEAGLAAADWHEALTAVQLSNSVTDERGWAWLATGLCAVGAEPEPTEDLALARVPFAEALEQVLAGRIVDLLSVALLLRAQHMAATSGLPAPLAAAMLRA